MVPTQKPVTNINFQSTHVADQSNRIESPDMNSHTYSQSMTKASLVAQLVKNLPTMRETRVQSLGWEDSLEKATLPTPVFLPGEFHGLYSTWGLKESINL